jgi:hypothetical protein
MAKKEIIRVDFKEVQLACKHRVARTGKCYKETPFETKWQKICSAKNCPMVEGR